MEELRIDELRALQQQHRSAIETREPSAMIRKGWLIRESISGDIRLLTDNEIDAVTGNEDL